MARNKLKDSDLAQVKVFGQETVEEVKPLPEPIQPKITFDHWWATKNLPQKLKKAIETHMNKRGFAQTQKFEEGLKDFGL